MLEMPLVNARLLFDIDARKGEALTFSSLEHL
jgi:hypothetical protein